MRSTVEPDLVSGVELDDHKVNVEDVGVIITSRKYNRLRTRSAISYSRKAIDRLKGPGNDEVVEEVPCYGRQHLHDVVIDTGHEKTAISTWRQESPRADILVTMRKYGQIEGSSP